MANTVSIYDGHEVTVSQLIGAPMVIPTRAIDLVRDNVLVEAAFRNGGTPPSPEVSYQRSAPVFLDGSPDVVGEFGEIPVFGSGEGEPVMAYGHKIGLGIRVSREMRDFNKIDLVRKQLTRARNTVIRASDKAMVAALDAASLNSVAATDEWDGASGKPRSDIAKAIGKVNGAVFDGDSDQPLGFVADTLILNPASLPALMDSDDFTSVYTGNIADQNIKFTGVLPGRIMGLTVLPDPFFPVNKALVLQRGVTGFYADARPLEATGLYAEGGGPNGGPTESWRSDMTQIRAIGVDEPLSACWITGISS